jgi:hypothetical protein
MKSSGRVQTHAGRLMMLSSAVLLVMATASCGVTSYVDEWADAQQRGYAILDDATFADIQRSALPLGQPHAIKTYRVTVTDFDPHGDESIKKQFPDARPPAGRYVVATIDLTDTGEEPPVGTVATIAPIDLEVRYAATDLRAYVLSSICASMTSPSVDAAPSPTNRSARLRVCFDVPAEHAAGGHLAIRANSDPINDRFTYWRTS